ncbi:uncharacterized protein IUM83_16556 [Phytophthora cinnamomi]|uniref:uncharacterized protein n=1 Tax=Phytophthora cinnamomi TaxID=4785 RepID=UPI003559C7A6|nr:hypothetical protein IUM83_16556 [Phytophthora cinnamomi]
MASSPHAKSAGVDSGVGPPVDDYPNSTPASASPPPTAASSRGAGAAPVLPPAPAVSVSPVPGADLPALAAADSAPWGVSLAELDAAPPSPCTALASSADLEEGEHAESKTRDLLRDDTAHASHVSASLAPARMASVISSSIIRAPLMGLLRVRASPMPSPSSRQPNSLSCSKTSLDSSSPNSSGHFLGLNGCFAELDFTVGSSPHYPSVRSGQEGFPLVESPSKPSSDYTAMRSVSPVAKAYLAGGGSPCSSVAHSDIYSPRRTPSQSPALSPVTAGYRRDRLPVDGLPLLPAADSDSFLPSSPPRRVQVASMGPSVPPDTAGPPPQTIAEL